MDLGPEGENNGIAKLPDHINVPSKTTTQPSIGYNPVQQKKNICTLHPTEMAVKVD